MSNNNQAAGVSIGFPGLLCILFIGLKLTGHITWSWIWVLSPLWIPIAILFVLLGLFAAVLSVAKTLEMIFGRGRR